MSRTSSHLSAPVRFPESADGEDLFSQETLSCGMWNTVDCRDSTVTLLSQLNDALEAERDFITLGLEASDPYQDFPWRNRDQDTSGF